MRTFSLVIALLLLGSSEGFAFECSGVRLPSSLVIRSDAELMKLADERQEAFSQAMARLIVSSRRSFWRTKTGGFGPTRPPAARRLALPHRSRCRTRSGNASSARLKHE